jgi:hypothetical protein
MRKTLMLIVAAAALTTWSVAQDQDNSAKQDMKNAGHSVTNAAKETGSGVKKGAVATKNKVTKEDAADEAAEKTVTITSGPNVNPTSNSATITWDTNKKAATDVWLTGGGIRGHRTQYARGGSKTHSVTFSNLKPHTTYNYEIRTREGGDRKQGSFTTQG